MEHDVGNKTLYQHEILGVKSRVMILLARIIFRYEMIKKCYITIFDTLILRYKKSQSAVMAILGLLQLCKYVMHQW